MPQRAHSPMSPTWKRSVPKQRWSSPSRKNCAYVSESGHLFITIDGSSFMFQPRKVYRRKAKK